VAPSTVLFLAERPCLPGRALLACGSVNAAGTVSSIAVKWWRWWGWVGLFQSHYGNCHCTMKHMPLTVSHVRGKHLHPSPPSPPPGRKSRQHATAGRRGLWRCHESGCVCQHNPQPGVTRFAARLRRACNCGLRGLCGLCGLPLMVTLPIFSANQVAGSTRFASNSSSDNGPREPGRRYWTPRNPSQMPIRYSFKGVCDGFSRISAIWVA
jgi:hypothetical protein